MHQTLINTLSTIKERVFFNSVSVNEIKFSC